MSSSTILILITLFVAVGISLIFCGLLRDYLKRKEQDKVKKWIKEAYHDLEMGRRRR